MLHDTHDMYKVYAECDRCGDKDPVIIRRPRLSDAGSVLSFRVESHDNCTTLPWHFHREYEIHLIIGATGRVFIGDYLGTFGPRNLIVTRPNVPHNWIGTNGCGAQLGCHRILVQFTSELLDNCIDRFPELYILHALMHGTRHDIEFSDKTISLARPIIAALQHSRGFEWIERFLKLLRYMGDDQERHLLSSVTYEAIPAEYADGSFSHVLAHVRMNYTGLLVQSDLATLCGYSKSVFQRHFRYHTGSNFTLYISRLGIFACVWSFDFRHSRDDRHRLCKRLQDYSEFRKTIRGTYEDVPRCIPEPLYSIGPLPDHV